MTNHILNKKVERGKVNDFKNFKSIGNMAWDFISAIYESEQDVLIADSNNASFRNKVVAKFMPKINNSNIPKNNSSKSNDKPATINRISPLIPAKSPKEISDIAKFFKISNQLKEKETQKKSYAQTLSLVNNIREVLKYSLTYR